MKYILFFLSLFLIGCGSSNKAYICGDHKCVNKKEAREYFEKNLNVEVEIKKKKNKNKNLDLAKLNTDVYLDENEEKSRLEAKSKLKKKNIEEKEKLAKETDIFYSEEELKTIEEKVASKEDAIKKEKEDAIKKEKEIKKLNKQNKQKSIKVSNVDPSEDFCKTMNNCDIEKISKHIMTVGKSKKYPNLSIK